MDNVPIDFQLFISSFTTVDWGDKLLWRGWIVLFLVLYLAVKWDERQQKKEAELEEDD